MFVKGQCVPVKQYFTIHNAKFLVFCKIKKKKHEKRGEIEYFKGNQL